MSAGINEIVFFEISFHAEHIGRHICNKWNIADIRVGFPLCSEYRIVSCDMNVIRIAGIFNTLRELIEISSF